VSLVLSVLAFGAAFLLTGAYYNYFVVPELVKKYPHDGQIGLGEFMGAINVGFVSAVVVLVAGILWSFGSAKRTESSDQHNR
jgi:hypothetical protein